MVSIDRGLPASRRRPGADRHHRGRHEGGGARGQLDPARAAGGHRVPGAGIARRGMGGAQGSRDGAAGPDRGTALISCSIPLADCRRICRFADRLSGLIDNVSQKLAARGERRRGPADAAKNGTVGTPGRFRPVLLRPAGHRAGQFLDRDSHRRRWRPGLPAPDGRGQRLVRRYGATMVWSAIISTINLVIMLLVGTDAAVSGRSSRSCSPLSPSAS